MMIGAKIAPKKSFLRKFMPLKRKGRKEIGKDKTFESAKERQEVVSDGKTSEVSDGVADSTALDYSLKKVSDSVVSESFAHSSSVKKEVSDSIADSSSLKNDFDGTVVDLHAIRRICARWAD